MLWRVPATLNPYRRSDFGARDIGEDGVIIALLHHSHRDPAT